MMPSMAHVGAYMIPSGVFTFCVHLEPAAALGSNSQISLVEDYVDIKAAQDVELVVSHCKPAWQNGACSIARPVVAAKEGRGISGRVVGKHASGGCGLARRRSRPRNRLKASLKQ